jgi:Domain of unknown function (DUF5615)
MIARPRTFLLDENMPRKILTSLRREGFNATRVYDAGLRSRPDTTIFAFARTYQMTIITFDTDYLNQTAFPPPHAGISSFALFQGIRLLMSLSLLCSGQWRN